jgi:hypothetical protein
LGLESVEQPVEDLLAADPGFVGALVALALEGGSEFECGLKVGA